MRKSIIVMAAALMLSVCAMAQGFPQGPGPRGGFDEAQMAQMRTDRMVQQLGLNETQAAQLLELNKKYPMSAMMGGPGGRRPRQENVDNGANDDTKAAKKEKKNKKNKKDKEAKPEEQPADPQAVMEAYENELKGILTEDQFKQYQENKNRRPQGRGPGGPGGFGPGGPGGPGGFGGPGGGPGGF